MLCSREVFLASFTLDCLFYSTLLFFLVCLSNDPLFMNEDCNYAFPHTLYKYKLCVFKFRLTHFYLCFTSTYKDVCVKLNTYIYIKICSGKQPSFSSIIPHFQRKIHYSHFEFSCWGTTSPRIMTHYDIHISEGCHNVPFGLEHSPSCWSTCHRQGSLPRMRTGTTSWRNTNSYS